MAGPDGWRAHRWGWEVAMEAGTHCLKPEGFLPRNHTFRHRAGCPLTRVTSSLYEPQASFYGKK
jgi:hypothetical protein